VRADYVKAFGEAPGALVGIGIMTDSDNTAHARGLVRPVRMEPWRCPISPGVLSRAHHLRETPFDPQARYCIVLVFPIQRSP
jgi:hypothetical protein